MKKAYFFYLAEVKLNHNGKEFTDKYSCVILFEYDQNAGLNYQEAFADAYDDCQNVFSDLELTKLEDVTITKFERIDK